MCAAARARREAAAAAAAANQLPAPPLTGQNPDLQAAIKAQQAIQLALASMAGRRRSVLSGPGGDASGFTGNTPSFMLATNQMLGARSRLTAV